KILQHQQAEPAPVSSFREDVSDDVLAILKRMLAKNPDERFQIPAAVALALAPHAREEPAGLESLSRNFAAFKMSMAKGGKDDTPLPNGLGGPVLGWAPVPGGVARDRCRLVVAGAADVGSFVDNGAGKLLAHALAHKPAFLAVPGEALLGSDDGNRDLEAARGARQSLTAGK